MSSKMYYVEKIKLGDKLAFEEAYYKYHKRFYFYVLKNTSTEDIAEEVVQMSFIRIWEKRSNLSNAFPFEVQLARLVRSIMIDLLRKKATERKVSDAIKKNTDAAIANDPLIGKQLKARVIEVVDNLPVECRKIFKLSREEGLSHSEIAEHLSISPKTVENQISKALKVIRKAVALYYIF